MGGAHLKVFSGVSSTCQLCGHGTLKGFAVPRGATLWRCTECGLYQSGLISNGPVIGETATAGEHHAGDEKHREMKLRTAMVRLNRIAPLVSADVPRLVDVGAGVGCVIEAALMRGWDAVGVDASPSAVEYCREWRLPCRQHDGGALPFDDESFDVLTAWRAIERVPDVTETLGDWYRVLRPGGVMAVETPDGASPMVRLLGRRYRRFWAPGHTYTFTPRTLAAFVRAAGFEVVRRPAVGRLTELSPGIAAYAIGYQAYQGLRKAAGVSQTFQIFARKPMDAADERLRVAA